jgi:hypothetical protein
LISTFLGEVMIRDVAVDPGESLVAVGNKYGWGTFQRELEAVFKATTAETIGRNVRLLEQICLANPREQEGWLPLCRTLAQALFGRLEVIDQEKPTYDWRLAKVDRAEMLAGLARALIVTEQSELFARVVAHSLALPEKYPLSLAHLPALVSLQSWLKKNVKQPCAGLEQWIASCREQLESLTARAPQEPSDFRRAAPISCKCADCGELKRFLEDPREPLHRFSVKEARRKHLEHSIRQNSCDLDVKTERGRSPYTLVCTKNTASYQEQLKKYRQDQEHFATVRKIQASLSQRAHSTS